MGRRSNVLHLLEPYIPFQPKAEKPKLHVTFLDKHLYPAFVLSIFLICSHLPLYGMPYYLGTADPFYWMRIFLGLSGRGTLMELGIGPIVASRRIMSFLVVSKIIKVDRNVAADGALQKGAQNLLALLLYYVLSAILVLSGNYGSVAQLGVGKALLIILQLFSAGIIVMCHNEVLENGHGLLSGVDLFRLSNICHTIFWKSFSTN